MRARTLVIATLGVLLLPAGAATAAGLSSATSADLGAARAAVLPCGSIGFDGTSFTVSTAGAVTEVKVAVDAAACAGARLDVVLADGAATPSVRGTGSLLAVSAQACPAGLCTVPVTGTPGLDVVKNVHVLATRP